MKTFDRNPTFRKRESSRNSDEEPKYEPRGDRPQRRGPSRFGRREERSDERGPSRFGRRDSGRSSVEMFKTTCDKCGEKCEVPFRPTAGKPVYCLPCYKQNEGSDSGRSDSRRSSFGRSDNNNSEQLSQINAKLDKIMKMMGIHDDSESE